MALAKFVRKQLVEADRDHKDGGKHAEAPLPAPAEKFCGQCRRSIPPLARFCPDCGTSQAG